MNKNRIYDIIDTDKECIVEGDFVARSNAQYKLNIMILGGDKRNLKIVNIDGKYDYIRKP